MKMSPDQNLNEIKKQENKRKRKVNYAIEKKPRMKMSPDLN